MKNILLTIDYSPASAAALKYAYMLNKHFFSKIHVVHIIDLPLYSSDQDSNMEEYQLLLESHEQRIWDFINTYREDIHYDIEVLVISGGHAQAISNIIKERSIDLMIMGNKGHSTVSDWMLGSLTKYFLRHASCMVISVPENYQWENIENIMICTDLSESIKNSQSIILKDFSEALKSNVEFIHVKDKMNMEIPSEEESKKFIKNTFGKDVILIPLKENVARSIIEYMNIHPSQLLVTFPHHHTWLDKLFLGSETESLAKIIQKPIMSLPN